MAKLEDLDIFEVSLVDSPANKRKYLMIKNESGTAGDIDVDGEKIDEDNKDVKVEKAGVSEDVQNAIKGALKILDKYKDDLPDNVKSALNALANVVGYGYPAPKEGKKNSDEEGYGYKKPAKKDIEGLLDEIQKQRDDYRKELAKAQEEINTLKEKEEMRELSEIAKSMNGSVEENVKWLKVLKSSLSPEDFAKAVEREKAYSNLLKQSRIFGEIGYPGGTLQGAVEKIETLAKSKVEKSEVKDMAKAIQEVAREYPELYKQYLSEMRGRN